MDKKFDLRQWTLKRAITSVDKAIESENDMLKVLLNTKDDLLEIYHKNIIKNQNENKMR